MHTLRISCVRGRAASVSDGGNNARGAAVLGAMGEAVMRIDEQHKQTRGRVPKCSGQRENGE